MKKTLIGLVAVVLILASCDLNLSDAIEGRWKWTEISFYDSSGNILDQMDMIDVQGDVAYYATWTFSDGTVTTREVAEYTDSTPTESIVIGSTSYAVIGNTIVIDGASVEFAITGNTLTIIYPYNDGSEDVYIFQKM